MRSTDVEEALRQLLGDAVGPQGLVVTVRRHDEYEALLGRLSDLQARYDRLDREYMSMSQFAVSYLQVLDELKIAVRMLDEAGLDTRWCESLRTR